MLEIKKELFENLTILYVEDDEMTSDEVTFFLKRYIKNIFVAKNGQEALEIFENNKIDLIITDIQMPIMNGLDMSKRILNINPNIPIIITTAYSDADYLIQAIELGIDKYILKPINLNELLVLIQKTMYADFKASKHYEEYIQFILDSNNSFMFILNSDKIEYVNKNLIDLLGEDSIKSINQKIELCKDLFVLEEVDTDLNYIDYITQNPHKTYFVTINKKEYSQFYKKKFSVKYKYFEDLNKSVFLFREINKEKMEKIKEIIDRLKSKPMDEEDSILVENLNEIIKIV